MPPWFVLTIAASLRMGGLQFSSLSAAVHANHGILTIKYNVTAWGRTVPTCKQVGKPSAKGFDVRETPMQPGAGVVAI